jgi:antitoxin component of RelBE/YafQ-DinJ toxin-antitoxin module
MTFVSTEWIAFLDDDDSIASTYVETFYNEIQTNCIDVILFRMHFNGEILPNLETDDFYRCKVGISFVIKKTIVDSGNVFSCSEYEDYEYLSLLKSKNYTIMISPHVIYFVREYNVCCNKTGNRLFLNEKNTSIGQIIEETPLAMDTDIPFNQIIEETPVTIDISLNQVIEETAVTTNMDISLNQIIREHTPPFYQIIRENTILFDEIIEETPLTIDVDISFNQIIKENTIPFDEIIEETPVAVDIDISFNQIIKENTISFDQIIKGNIDNMDIDTSMNLVITENIDTISIDNTTNLVIEENDVITDNYIMPEHLTKQYCFYKKYKKIKI